MKKKILIIMPSMFIGGAERSLLGLLEQFDYEKYDVDLFLKRHEGEFLSHIPEKVNLLEENKKYRTFDVPIKGLLRSQPLFAVARIMSKLALRLHCLFTGEKPGVWMGMQYTSKYLCPLLPKIDGEYDAAISFLGVPDILLKKVSAKIKIAWNHTDYRILGPCKKYDLKIYSKLDYIVSVSDRCTKQFLSVYPQLKEKAVTVENIISREMVYKFSEESIEDFPQEDSTKLLSVGRFSDAKNFDNVPEICRLVRQQGLNIKWYLIGYGGDEALIKSKIAEAGMEDYVIILGKKENPYPYIKACDLYVQPSRYEGKAVTVREAQILHKPVVITAFETSKSQLTDGFDGVIVPMDNEGCAAGIASVLRDENLRQRLIDNTKKTDYTNSDETQKIYRLVE